MKKSVFIFGMIIVITLSASLGITSCKPTPSPEPPPTVKLIKFAKPEYKYFVLAEYNPYDSVFSQTYPHNECEDAGRSGYSPYWELPDNWLLIDWKWNLNSVYEIVLLTNYTWEQYMSYIKNDSIPTWSFAEPHVSHPIEQELYINLWALDKYKDSITPYQTYQSEPDEEPCSERYVEFCDHAMTYIYNQLSLAIKNGDLNKYNF